LTDGLDSLAHETGSVFFTRCPFTSPNFNYRSEAG